MIRKTMMMGDICLHPDSVEGMELERVDITYHYSQDHFQGCCALDARRLG
jgi:hypothetical protein